MHVTINKDDLFEKDAPSNEKNNHSPKQKPKFGKYTPNNLALLIIPILAEVFFKAI